MTDFAEFKHQAEDLRDGDNSHVIDKNEGLMKVMAGVISMEDFFSKDKYKKDKDTFMLLYKSTFNNPAPSLFSDEAVAAAWIVKLRFNEQMSDAQFKQLINRANDIFTNPPESLDLSNDAVEKNDLIAIMWGIEALNGIQTYDSGATRVRFKDGVGPCIMSLLEDAGAKPRSSTHATMTKLTANGIGKDLPNETLRKFTPRGVGALLVHPTAKTAIPRNDKEIKPLSAKLTDNITENDYDLLFKRENYGYNDSKIHSRVHSKMGFVNYLDSDTRDAYKEGSGLIRNKSNLAKEAEGIHGKGEKIHRKEHLTELKSQSVALVKLLEAGHQNNLFLDYKTKYVIRIKIPPWEKKIVSANVHEHYGLGSFLKALQQQSDTQFGNDNKDLFEEIRPLLDQASTYTEFDKCREGNEVMVRIEGGKANVLDALAKNSTNTPVDRQSLIQSGMITDNPPNVDLQEYQLTVKTP